MFDYQGLTAQELENLCDKKNIQKYNIRPMYHPGEIYSQGYYYRKYARFPHCLPLMIFSEHGIEFGSVEKNEIENDAYAMFVFSDYKKEKYEQVSSKNCYKVLHPLVWYRKNNVQQSDKAKGTIAFPAHSTKQTNSFFDIDLYVKELKSLPDEMQPVCVAMHISDINKGQHLEFIKRGIAVYTAGNPSDYRFGERFYNILKHFKYGTSNLVGSYAYYCIEMGIPFSLFGQKSEYRDVIDNYKRDYNEIEGYCIAESVFSGIHRTITIEQKLHVEASLGMKSYLTRDQMKKILYKALFKNGLTLRVLFYIIKYLIGKYIFRCKL